MDNAVALSLNQFITDSRKKEPEMPRKIKTGGSSHTYPNQAAAAANDAPIARTPPQQSVPESSAQPSLAKSGRSTVAAMRLQKQLKEKQDAAQAYEWKEKFLQYFMATTSLVNDNFPEAFQKGLADFEGCQKTETEIGKNPANKAPLEKLLIAQLNRSIRKLNEAQFYLGECPIGGINVFERLRTALESFDALENKGDLFARDPDLEKLVNQIQTDLSVAESNRVVAAYSASSAMHRRDSLVLEQLLSECAALIGQTKSGYYSDSVRSSVERLITALDESSAEIMTTMAKEEEVVNAYDKLLADPYLAKVSKAKASKAKKHLSDAKEHQSMAQQCSHASSFMNANNTALKIQLLISFIHEDNREQPGKKKLEEWKQTVERLLLVDYGAAIALIYSLKDEEKEAYQGRSTLSPEELSVRLEAANTLLARLETIAGNCEKRAAQYENLTGIKKDDRLVPFLKKLAVDLAVCIPHREHALQVWTDRLEEAKAKSSAAASSSSQPAPEPATKASSRLAGKKALHRTKEGVIVGTINQKGRLDGLDDKGQIISNFFQDEDSGDWVRGYEDEPDPATPALASTSTASAANIAAGEKAEHLYRKTQAIVNNSIQEAQEARAKAKASGDYDDKIDLLYEAFRKEARVTLKVNAALAELKELQAGDSLEQDRHALLHQDLELLRADKKKLYVEHEQAQKDRNIHSKKRRDPTEANFRFLWKEGQVASITKELDRRQNRANAADFLDRYVVSLKPGPQGERYEPWIVHAHYSSSLSDAAPMRVHMKRNVEKDWGMELPAYHSRPLNQDTFKLVERETLRLSTVAQRGL